MRTLAMTLAVLPLAMACGSSEGDDMPAPTDVDVRVAIPKPDPAMYLDYETPEVTLAPGEEQMWCYHIEYDGEDIAIKNLDALQGKFGHHIALLQTTEPQPPGTLEDCSAEEQMSKYSAYIVPSVELPAGHGIFFPKGQHIVLQFHYLNTGAKPLRIRDVARLHKRPISEVTTWTSSLAINTLDIEVPAQGTREVSFDCTIPEDVKLMILAGHMHENGSRFEVEHGDDETSLESIYLVDPWRPDYRDSPPVTLFTKNPRALAKNSLLRTTCAWKNGGSTTLDFPQEMCTGFGYITGTKTPFSCDVAKNP